MQIDKLRKRLELLAAKRDAQWYDKLSPRKKAEAEHHDVQRDSALTEKLPEDVYEMLHGNKKFYSTVELSARYFKDWLARKVPGKIVLDFACGNGDQVIRSAELGAALAIGIDISGLSIKNAKRKAREARVEGNTFFLRGDCEATGLPDSCIDVVLCSGVLHHMDLSYAFPEIRRILKKGGCALGVEALDYNPVIKLYRKMTPHMRTDWEKKHILSNKDLRFASRFFQVKNVKYWHLFSVLAAYVRGNEKVFSTLLEVANGVDQFLTALPGVQRLAWQFTFELYKA